MRERARERKGWRERASERESPRERMRTSVCALFIAREGEGVHKSVLVLTTQVGRDKVAASKKYICTRVDRDKNR